MVPGWGMRGWRKSGYEGRVRGGYEGRGVGSGVPGVDVMGDEGLGTRGVGVSGRYREYGARGGGRGVGCEWEVSGVGDERWE